MNPISRSFREASRGWLIALVLWALFIWANSLIPGETSSSESGFILELLRPLLQAIGVTDMDAAHTFIRKCGHFTEYLVLGVLAWKSFGREGLAAVALFGLVVPCADETIQRFVPGRCGMVGDVLIDMAGFAAGVAILWLVGRRAKRID